MIVQSYTYDNLNRIASARETYGSGTQSWKEVFSYDRFGNRKFGSGTTTTSGCATANCNPTTNTANNRINNGQGYVYDKTGNVTQDAGGQRFAFDAENHQSKFYAAGNSGSTPNATYLYDGDGKRVRKIASGKETVFVYNAGGSLIAEYETSFIAAAANTKYLTQDHLGSSRAITSQTGAMVSRHDYRAFGEEVYSGTANRTNTQGYGKADGVRKQYTGYERDYESGLDFAQARYYNSKLGRFTSVDPLTASANVKDPQTFNRYSYAMNSPYKFTDPLGLLAFEAVDKGQRAGEAMSSTGYSATVASDWETPMSETAEDYAEDVPTEPQSEQNEIQTTGQDQDPDYPGCEEWEPGGGGTPTPTPATPTPTPPNDEWNNDNNETADDPAVQPGTPANNGTAGAGSGNFGFSAPVASLPGRNGLNVNLSLNYNSLLWHKEGNNITYDIDKGSPAPGWDIGFGKILDMDTTGGAMLESINGTRHSYAGDTVAGAAGYSTYYGRTTDGSFSDYIVSRTPSGITSGTAYFPDGTKATYGAPFDGVIYPTQIKDKHGNYITITYVSNKGPNINTIKDTLGRVITFKYQSGRLISVKGPGYNGTTQTYVRLHYTQKTLSATFSGLTKGVRNASPYQLDSIFYPVTKTGYWFKDSDSYSSYGMIKKVMMNRNMTSSGTDTSQGNVTKGTMSSQTIYNYPASASNLSSAPQYTNKTETWASMDTGAAVTSYSVNNTANPRTTTITLPNGTKSKTYSYNNTTWNDGMLYKTEFLASNNAVLSRQQMTWAQGYNTAPRVTQILATDEKNQTSKQTFTYDTYYNQVKWAYEYGLSNRDVPFIVKTLMVSCYENVDQLD